MGEPEKTLDGRCGTCPFWERWTTEKAESGKCRRFPPQLVMVMTGSIPEIQERQPVTNQVNWCGEHPKRRQVVEF